MLVLGRRARLRAATAVVSCLLGCATAIGGGRAAAADPVPTSPVSTGPCAVTALLVNPCRPWVGAESNGYVPGAGFADRIKDHEDRIGHVDIAHDYVTTGSTLKSGDVAVAKDGQHLLFVNWKMPADTWASANGSDAMVDASIDSMAESISSLGTTKILFTLEHEPEKNIVAGGAPGCPSVTLHGSRGTTADYVAMWRHVHDRFAADGVGNVVWVMNYMGYDKFFCAARDLWPGDDDVDWVMWDPYPNASSFTTTVGSFYSYLEQHSGPGFDVDSKPWGLAEWGYAGTDQAKAYAMYDEALGDLHDGVFPRLKAYVVWDNKVTGDDGNDDRVSFTNDGQPDPVEEQHYRAFATDPALTDDVTAPSAPGDLVAAGGSHHVDLSWSAATDDRAVAHYEVLRDDVVVATTAQPAFSDTGLDDVTTYSYAVRAVDGWGNVGPEVTAQATTLDTTPPTVPGKPRTALAGTTVMLSWPASQDAVGVSSYVVYRNGAPLAAAATPAYTDITAPQGRTDSYTVRAVDAAGNTSAPSPPAAVAVPDRTAPGKVPGLVATGAAKRVTLGWRAATDNVAVVGYRVYHGTTLVKSLGATTRSYAVTGLHSGTTYTYAVVALDAAGNRSAPATASAKAK